MIDINRKAQVEIIGLVIIVILISLGMLFMAQFALKEGAKKKIFTRKGLATSTMSALMKTTVSDQSCSGTYQKWVQPQLGKDLLEDCAKNYDYYSVDDPSGYSLYQCQEVHSCHFVSQLIKELLNGTLGGWNKKYVFQAKLIRSQEDDPITIVGPIKVGEGCPRSKDRDVSGLFPIHTDAGLIMSELYLCD
jgi:hypothetical protein